MYCLHRMLPVLLIPKSTCALAASDNQLVIVARGSYFIMDCRESTGNCAFSTIHVSTICVPIWEDYSFMKVISG